MNNKWLMHLFLLFYTPFTLAEFIATGAETTQESTNPFGFSLNIGPGWYKTDFGIIGTSLIPLPNQELRETPILSTFSSQIKTLGAFVADFTVKPHPSCFITLNGGAGILRNGKATFRDFIQDSQNCYSKTIRSQKVPFNYKTFNINFSSGFDVKLHSHITLQPSLGYSYSYGLLQTSQPKKVNYNTFKFITTGPLMRLGGIFDYKKYSFELAYTFVYGSYTEKDRGTEPLSLQIPTIFINHLDLLFEYTINKNYSTGVIFALDFFKNHGRGTVQLCSEATSALKNPYVEYAKTTTIVLLGFISFSF